MRQRHLRIDGRIAWLARPDGTIRPLWEESAFLLDISPNTRGLILTRTRNPPARRTVERALHPREPTTDLSIRVNARTKAILDRARRTTWRELFDGLANILDRP